MEGVSAPILYGNREAWEPILEAARRGGVVLLYSARDAERNNAVALRDYLVRENANVFP